MSHAGTTSAPGGLNLGYMRTIPGLLQSGQLVALLVTFLCIHLSRGWPSWYAFQFFEVVALWFLVALLVFFFIHIFSLNTRTPCINCPLTVRRDIAPTLLTLSPGVETWYYKAPHR
uniref:Cytochrome b n=1 Tax=Knipowitschia caucasica TaxID=637954 RepID=A0AAV2ME01_KNICA